MEITAYQRVELENKTYDVIWYGDKARICVLTKTGRRTLNGYGKANHANTFNKVFAKAKLEKE